MGGRGRRGEKKWFGGCDDQIHDSSLERVFCLWGGYLFRGWMVLGDGWGFPRTQDQSLIRLKG